MKMLVTDLSCGKYKNEGELFAEPISAENVKLMGEMIALQLFRTRKKYYCKIADKLYIGLIKDLRHMNESGYILSDGYDYAQIAICFLWQYKGKKADNVCYADNNGREIRIKLACYRTTGRNLDRYRRKVMKAELKSFEDYKVLTAASVTYFKQQEPDYNKADTIMEAMHLTEAEKETLRCYMNGMMQSEAALALCITIFGVKYRKMRIHQKYITYIGEH